MKLVTNLQALMAREGLNAHALAARIKETTGSNVGQPTIFRILEGESKTPRDNTLQPIADYFGVTVPALRYEDLTSNNKNDANVAEESASYGLQYKGVPVVGYAQLGEEGYWEETDFPVGHGDGYVSWPSHDPNAYSLKVYGDSMKPRIKHGEYVVIEPRREPGPGDEVLLKTTGGQAMVKEMLYWRDGRLYVTSVNQESGNGIISFAREEIEKVHYVAGIAKAHMHKER